jgi:hypothetical protein
MFSAYLFFATQIEMAHGKELLGHLLCASNITGTNTTTMLFICIPACPESFGVIRLFFLLFVNAALPAQWVETNMAEPFSIWKR